MHWSQLALPDNAPPNARYRPICPFCAKPLKTPSSGASTAGAENSSERPFNRILFQEPSQEDDGEGGGPRPGGIVGLDLAPVESKGGDDHDLDDAIPEATEAGGEPAER